MANIFDLGDDWTESGTVYDAIKIDVTDTASDATSKLLDLQIGGTSKFKVDKGGNVTLAGSITGLDQVDNTSDLDKPVSTLQATAIGVVQTDVDNHEALTNNPHTVTAAQVGLGNVDNTSDLDKPVSTLQATAIGVVQTDVDNHEALTNNPHTVTAAQVGLGNVDNTSDLDKPVSTLQATAIGVVQTDVDNHEALTNNPHTVTAAQVGLGNVDNTSDLDKPISTLTQAAIDAAGGGAFGADANTLITPSTPIVLDQATGDETALTLSYTTNKATSGNDTGLLINQTDTLSPGTSKLMDLQVGGTSKFSVAADANIHITEGNFTGRTAITLPDFSNIEAGNGRLWFQDGVGTIRQYFERGLELWQNGYLGICAGSPLVSAADVRLYRDAGNTFGQRNGINPQTFRVYNTYTNATNYERGHIGWNDTADTFVIGTEAAGGGTLRGLSLGASGNSVSLYGVTPVAQASHIADATDATDVITRVNAILVALENIGITAAV